MNTAEFRELVHQRTDVQLLGPCLHDEVAPYVCELQPAAWDLFRDELVAGLGIARGDIRIVGSGRLGFSLKPGYALRAFRDTSDIDVVVVNPEAFDRLWLALLAAAYPRPPNLQLVGGWLKKRTNEVYTGWLTPLKIKLDSSILGAKARPVKEAHARWFTTLKKASRHPLRRHEDITGRLYRSWEHAEMYHLHSLAALRKSLNE
jgi:hypothetical protein